MGRMYTKRGAGDPARAGDSAKAGFSEGGIGGGGRVLRRRKDPWVRRERTKTARSWGCDVICRRRTENP